MQDLKVGDYVHVVKKANMGADQFYGTVEEVMVDEETGKFTLAIVRPDSGRQRRLVFPHNQITLVNLIEANE